ncbi:MAG: FliG C-terminal domain-containing protein [Pseudomonadota bacterium]
MTTPPDRSAKFSPGLLRSARLLKALGPDAAGVWSALRRDEAETLSAVIDQLPDDATDADAAADRLLSHAPPQTDVSASVWQRLSRLAPADIVSLLSDEHPQLFSMVLSRIAPRAAADTVRYLPPGDALDVLRGMVRLETPGADILATVEMHLGAKLDQLPAEPAKGDAALSEIFDELGGDQGEVLLQALEQSDPALGARIRGQMFTFDDIAGLSPAGLQTLLARTDRSALICALTGESGPVSKALFANMTSRASDLLKDEMEAASPVSRDRILAARQSLARLARELIRRGEITSKPDIDDELIA